MSRLPCFFLAEDKHRQWVKEVNIPVVVTAVSANCPRSPVPCNGWIEVVERGVWIICQWTQLIMHVAVQVVMTGSVGSEFC